MITKAWLFPGQGSQYTQMGRHIWQHKLAADVLSMAESISGLPLQTVMDHGPESALRSPEYLEPCIVALQAAYVLLLQNEGLQADAVAGYSLGEMGALYCAGCLSLLDLLVLASERGKILARNAKRGNWLSRAVRFPHDPVALPLDGTTGIFIAAYNSPREFTITGEAENVAAVEQILTKRGAVLSSVAIAGPWHSPLAADSAREAAELLRSIQFRKPVIPICLGTSANFESDTETLRNSLSRQLESPVLWQETLERLWHAGVRSTFEIGPGRVLSSFMRANWPQRIYHSQFLERQGGRAVDFAALKSVEAAVSRNDDADKEKSWTRLA